MKKPKRLGKLYNLYEYRFTITVPVRCMMADCVFTGTIPLRNREQIDQTHCPKCVNQSLQIVYTS